MLKKFYKIVLFMLLIITLTGCSHNNGTTLVFFGEPSSSLDFMKITITIKGKDSSFHVEGNTPLVHFYDIKSDVVKVSDFKYQDKYNWANELDNNINDYDLVYETDMYTILRDLDKENNNSVIKFAYSNEHLNNKEEVIVGNLEAKEILEFNKKPMSTRSVYSCDYHTKNTEAGYYEYYEVRPFIEILDEKSLLIYNHTYKESRIFDYYPQSNNTIKLVDTTTYTEPKVVLFIDDSKKVLTLVDGDHVERYKLYTDDLELHLFNVKYLK